MTHSPIVAPSILAGNHARLAESLAQAEAVEGITWLHLDIMDGHFVPNLSFGPQTVADLRPLSRLFFDVHLMLSRPDRYIDAFAKAGAQNITIHVEPEYDHHETLRRIHDLGATAGICVNPGTPAEALLPYLDEVELVLLMTVQPGFGGQAFRSDVLPKMETLDRWRREGGYKWRLEVDGGIDDITGAQCRKAGVDTFVSGSAFFNAEDKVAFCRKITHP